MTEVKFSFDETKATQVVGAFIAESGDFVDWYWLQKCLYALDHRAMEKWRRPVLGGEYRMLKLGPVNQSAMDAFRPRGDAFFWQCFEREGNQLRMKRNPGRGEVSDEELSLIREIVAEWKGLGFQEAHAKSMNFPECRKFDAVSEIPTVEILKAGGAQDEEIEALVGDESARNILKHGG